MSLPVSRPASRPEGRLHAELARLYPAPEAEAGPTRTLVLELARPADWAALGTVWRGVQADLGLPAPAIAVSGTDGLQLWFSLQQPVGTARAAAFLAGLRARYLPGIAPARVRTLPPAGDAGWPRPEVPALQAGGENWSAFVAPDLAPIFSDTPWLDVPPSPDGQADLLAPLRAMPPDTFDTALQALQPAVAADAPAPATAATAPVTAPSLKAGVDLDPRAFLQRVLNDESAPLALRVEAAKTLLGRG